MIELAQSFRVIVVLWGLIFLSACQNPGSGSLEPLDISNDHFLAGGNTVSGYWKLDIKDGYGIYSSASFDAPVELRFIGMRSTQKIVLDNGSAVLTLVPGKCQNTVVSGGFLVSLELNTRVLSGCAQQNALPQIRTIVASGNEPFWNFRITGDQAVYSSPEMLEGVTIPLTKTGDQYGTHYSGQLHGGIFTLSVAEARCEDDMSGYEFPMTVKLRKDGNTYNGCARLD